MKTTDKELLLKDLSARLPYKVKCFCKWTKEAPNGTVGCIQEISTFLLDELEIMDKPEYSCQVSEIKPYLRPMSSMMRGEWEEMTALIYPHGRINRNPDNKNELLLWLSAEGNEMPIMLMNNVFSWLNEHHFDYRGLIEKGLALEAPEGLYVFKPNLVISDENVKVGLDRALQIVKTAKGNLPGYQTDDGIYECDHAIETLEHILMNGIEERPKLNKKDKKKIEEIIEYLECYDDFDCGDEPYEAYCLRFKGYINFMESLLKTKQK